MTAREVLEVVRRELDVYRRALTDDRTPKIAKWLLGGAVAYLLSPIDIVPDFIPVLGHLDDVVVVTALVQTAVKMIPPEVMEDARAAVARARPGAAGPAEGAPDQRDPRGREAAEPPARYAYRAPLKLYFICVGNSCRSQMAEGFARHLGGSRVDARSAGTMPAASVSRNAIAVMKEKGVDISDAKPKAIDLAFAQEAEHVITMGCSAEDACPAHIVARMVDWGLEDPVGKPMEAFREVRDEIERRVRDVLRGEGLLE